MSVTFSPKTAEPTSTVYSLSISRLREAQIELAELHQSLDQDLEHFEVEIMVDAANWKNISRNN